MTAFLRVDQLQFPGGGGTCYTIQQGSPTPGLWTGTNQWPVSNRAAHRGGPYEDGTLPTLDTEELLTLVSPLGVPPCPSWAQPGTLLPARPETICSPAACSFPGENARSWEALGATRVSWSPLSGLKGVQPPLPFGERTRDCSPGHALSHFSGV